MTDSVCESCRHVRKRDNGTFCASPQVLAFWKGTIRTLFERDSLREDHRGEHRKCGPQHVNWEKRE
jgi:hypothetical protein